MDKGENGISDLKGYLALAPVLKYFFRKNDTEHEPHFSLKIMHWINKFSIIIFLMGIIYLASKHIL